MIVEQVEMRRHQFGVGITLPHGHIQKDHHLVEPPLPPGRILRVKMNSRTEIILTPSRNGVTAIEKFKKMKKENPNVQIISSTWVCPKKYPNGKPVQ
jgi:hypothetical protein